MDFLPLSLNYENDLTIAGHVEIVWQIERMEISVCLNYRNVVWIW